MKITHRRRRTNIDPEDIGRIYHLLYRGATHHKVIYRANARTVRIQSITVSRLSHRAHLNGLPRGLNHAIVTQGVNGRTVGLLTCLRTLVGLLRHVNMTARTGFGALGHGTLISSLLFGTVTTFPRMARGMHSLTQYTKRTGRRVSILTTRT